ncbi:unnamed protein product [Polarella glacialis]|uniref:Uncharacterized protein n=1 Tax=Polarella glacialis TaxID=89957 RepID=A0A813L952_POLGL|nr:unnamed protein product [Polarella glacialis]
MAPELSDVDGKARVANVGYPEKTEEPSNEEPSNGPDRRLQAQKDAKEVQQEADFSICGAAYKQALPRLQETEQKIKQLGQEELLSLHLAQLSEKYPGYAFCQAEASAEGVVGQVEGKVGEAEAGVEGAVAGVEGKVGDAEAGVEGAVAGVEGKVGDAEASVQGAVTGAEASVAGVEAGVEAGVGKAEGMLGMSSGKEEKEKEEPAKEKEEPAKEKEVDNSGPLAQAEASVEGVVSGVEAEVAGVEPYVEGVAWFCLRLC